MRWQTLQAQLERALATSEATLSLLREQLSLQEARRQSDREWFESQVARLEQGSSMLADALGGKMDRGFNGLQQGLGEKLDMLHEQAGVPSRDLPTVEEMILQAKSEPVLRKQLEATLAELEFSDPQIEFN